jgi:hypothetical protein
MVHSFVCVLDPYVLKSLPWQCSVYHTHLLGAVCPPHPSFHRPPRILYVSTDPRIESPALRPSRPLGSVAVVGRPSYQVSSIATKDTCEGAMGREKDAITQ